MSELLLLSQQEPLAKGHSRLVFQHPDRDDWLVKVIRPDRIEARFGKGAAWYKRKRRYGQYLSYVRESQEYIALWRQHNCELPYIQKVVGFAVTDLGLGFIIASAKDRDGKLAPTLADLIIMQRFDSKVREDLAVFFDNLLSAEIIISDLNMGNIVYAHNEMIGDHFVLIDGLGDNTFLSLKSISRWINRRSKLGRIRKLLYKIDSLLNKVTY